MTPLERAARLRTLADAATPGPWCYEQVDRGATQVGLVWDDDDRPLTGAIGPDDGTVVEHVGEINRSSDGALIAALGPDAARWIADAVDALRRVLAEEYDDDPEIMALLSRVPGGQA